MISEREARKQIVEVGRWLYEKDLIVATDGNLSVKLNNRIIATPSGVSKGFLKENELVVVDLEGNKITGSGKPSTELKMHLEVYKVRPDVQAVVHAHPPKCTAFTIAGVPLTQCVMPEVVVSLGAIPTAPYATPSTDEVVLSIREPIQQTDAVMLDRHGSLTVGDTIYTAYRKLEKMEHAAEVMMYARMLGGVQTLSTNEVDKLMALRSSTYGLKGNILKCDSPHKNPVACENKSCSSNEENNMSEEELIRVITQKVIEQLKSQT